MEESNFKKLEYGETPWDDLNKEELLLLVKKMYSALNSDLNVLNAVNNPDSLFWSNDGPGECALEKTKQIIDKIHSEYSSENIFRAYFRYANDLLFNNDKNKWCICPLCGELIKDRKSINFLIGKKCGEIIPKKTGYCEGILRPITYEDLKSKKSKSKENVSETLKGPKHLEEH